ncbi:MAG: hypothetical protein PHG23_03300 [Candidatus Pacebacteria bacterium]|nr:hypothetical protein [Candidatus Paceibacterota bacterium]
MESKTASNQSSGLENPNTEPFFYIPLLERVINLGKPYPDIPVRQKYVEIGGIGALIKYEQEKDLAEGWIKKWIKNNVGFRMWDFCVIQAATPEDAIKKFYEIYPGAKIGKKSKALIINRKKRIIELPRCYLLYQGSKEGRFVCGPLKEGIDYDSGEFGMCVLDFADYPDGYCGLRDVGVGNFSFPEEFPEIKAREIFVNKKKYLFISLN